MTTFQKGDKVRVNIVNGQDFPLLRRVGTIVQIQEHYGTTADVIVRFRTGEYIEIDEINLVRADSKIAVAQPTLDELEENVIEFVANMGDWRRLNGLRREEEAKYRLEVAKRVKAA